MQGPAKGLGLALAKVFGGPVTVTPVGGAARVVQGIYREFPFLVDAENGLQIEVLKPGLRLPKNDAQDLKRGALVDPGEGEVFKVLHVGKTASPQPDGLILLQLELD